MWLTPACAPAEGEPDEPAPPEAAVTEDWREMQRERYPELVDELIRLERRVDRRPDVASLRSKLGRLYFRLGRPEPAREQLQRALDLDATHYPAHYNLGVIAMSQGDFAGAAELLVACLRHAPDFPAAHRELGLARLELGDEERARAAFASCAELDSADPECAFRLGQLSFEDDDFDAARTWLERALELDPYHLGAPSALARLERIAGDHDAASEWQERHTRTATLADLGLLSEPTSLRRYLVEAHYYLDHARWEAAARSCREGLEHFPEEEQLLELEIELHAAREAAEAEL